MCPQFAVIVEKLVSERGKSALIDPAKCKAYLADYAQNEFKKSAVDDSD
ncbi:MAG: hypothetical protein LBT81_01430 [Helicobacteraceae bacterium]|jgi:hypothetical protein|nr:hypothetical protein [Helicobacteraceae bacterium]